jgi:hypothetical protein
MSWGATALTNAFVLKRDPDRAIEFGELAATSAPTLSEKVMAQTWLAWAKCNSGETSKGIELLAGLLRVLQGTDNPTMETVIRGFLAEGYWLAGECEKGRQTAREYLELADRCGARFHIGYAHLLLGRTSSITNPAEVASHFDKSIAIFREIKAESFLPIAYAGYGRLHKLQCNIAQAREYLTDALEIFERLGTLLEPEKVKKELEDLPETG